MRLLLINPNTSTAITDKVAAAGRAVARPDTEIAAVGGRFGATYIASRAAYAIAAHAALDAWAAAPAHDVAVLACFGDPGLEALREIADVPVIGLADASLSRACELGRRFAIVTGGDRWGPMLAEFVAARGLTPRLAGIRTVAPDGAAIARDPQGSISLLAGACRAAIEADGADVVILGGAGLAGLAAAVQPGLNAPVLDSVEVAVRLAETAAGRPRGARLGLDTVGLSEALKDRLGRM